MCTHFKAHRTKKNTEITNWDFSKIKLTAIHQMSITVLLPSASVCWQFLFLGPDTLDCQLLEGQTLVTQLQLIFTESALGGFGLVVAISA